MTTTVAVLLVLGIVAGMAWSAYRNGLFFSTYALTRNLIAFLVAMTAFEPLGARLGAFVSDSPQMVAYCQFVSFVALFAGVFMMARWLKVKFLRPDVRALPILEMGLSPLFGVANGVIMTGLVLLGWSLFPAVKYLPADAGRINTEKMGVLDTGGHILTVYDFLENRMGGSKEFKLKPDDPGEKTWMWRYRTHADIFLKDVKAISPQAFESP